MDIVTLDLLRRGVRALESIAQALTQPEPANPESDQTRHLLLSASVRCQVQRLGYDQDDYAQAKKLLASTFDGKTTLKELSIAQLTEYAKLLRDLEGLKNDRR